MRIFGNITLRLTAVAAIVGLAVFGSLYVEGKYLFTNQVAKQVEKNYTDLTKAVNSHLTDRIAEAVDRQGIIGTPSTRLLEGQAQSVIGSFDGDVTIFRMPLGAGVPAYTTLTQTDINELLRHRDKIEMGQDYFIGKLFSVDNLIKIHGIQLSGGTRTDLIALYQMPKNKFMSGFVMIESVLKMHAVIGFAVLVFIFLVVGRIISGRLKKIHSVVDKAAKGHKTASVRILGFGQEASLAVAVNRLVQGPSKEKEKVQKQADTDALTGLLNRRGLIKAMDDTIGAGRKEISVMFLDLDGFKPINDTYGHDVGDQILIEVAKRLRNCVRDDDIVCRLGGDEFVLMFDGLVSKQGLENRAAKVLERINEPYWIQDNRVTMGVSVGIAVGPADGETGDALLNASDEAMYAAKKTGKNQFTFYS